MLPQLYLFAYVCFTLGSVVMILSIVRYAYYVRYVIPKKDKRRIVLDENKREESKNITLLIPAFKETEVIENTIASVAKINYYRGKFHALIILDEKELASKRTESKIIIPAARDILDGRYSDDALTRLILEQRPDLHGLKPKDLGKWTDHYRKRAEVLAIAVLSRFAETELAEEIVPIAYIMLRGLPLNGQRMNGSYASNVTRAKELIERERSAGDREDSLQGLYQSHPAFETTIDIVKRLKAEHNSSHDGLIEYTIVPSNYDGSYRDPKILTKSVQSSKGRALNWALNQVEKLFPDTDIIGVYDSDARPHEDVLAYINREMLKNPSKYVFYQGPIYLVRNFFTVNWICKQSGLQGTCWHRILYPINIHKHQNDVIHFSGTNYFFTIDAIRQTNGYPPFHPTEDLGLAYDVYALRLEGKLPDLRIVPHPYEELEQTTQTWKAWFRQQYRWASGGPYQLKRVLSNKGLSWKHKFRMAVKLVSPFPLAIYGFFLGITGVTLTALALLGLAEYPRLPPELVEVLSNIMLVGFAAFLGTPVAIYLWSIKKDYLEAGTWWDKLSNVLVILVTTIPYFLAATIPAIQAWTNPLRGWGAKTPRTDERIRSREERYLATSKEFILPLQPRPRRRGEHRAGER